MSVRKKAKGNKVVVKILCVCVSVSILWHDKNTDRKNVYPFLTCIIHVRKELYTFDHP